MTAIKSGTELESGDVLVGTNDGRSLIHEVEPSSVMQGLLRVETEHGPLYLDPDEDFEVEN